MATKQKKNQKFDRNRNNPSSKQYPNRAPVNKARKMEKHRKAMLKASRKKMLREGKTSKD